jgi:hypothetical protein
MIDYPFYNWKTFATALNAFLATEHYYRKFPKYAEQHEMGGGTEIRIIKELLKTGDPQEGFDVVTAAILNRGKYSSDIKKDIPEIIKLFIDAGAKPNIDSLFKLEYPDDDHFEDEVSHYRSRAWLIDVYDKHGFDMTKYYDWSSIEGIYWEDIDQEIIDKQYHKACFMALKYYSDCLTNL